MKNISFGVLLVLLAALGSCKTSSSDRGEVRGVYAKAFKQEQPYGMVAIEDLTVAYSPWTSSE